jgi:hypothetical protein
MSSKSRCAPRWTPASQQRYKVGEPEGEEGGGGRGERERERERGREEEGGRRETVEKNEEYLFFLFTIIFNRTDSRLLGARTRSPTQLPSHHGPPACHVRRARLQLFFLFFLPHAFRSSYWHSLSCSHGTKHNKPKKKKKKGGGGGKKKFKKQPFLLNNNRNSM